MTSTEQVLHLTSVAASEAPGRAVATWSQRVRDMASRLRARITQLVEAHAEASAAAAIYAELSKLSDAELRRRGLTRAELHRWVSGGG